MMGITATGNEGKMVPLILRNWGRPVVLVSSGIGKPWIDPMAVDHDPTSVFPLTVA
jgi:hypothetical protein